MCSISNSFRVLSVWFYQANAHNRQTKNAALASLFKRATALFSLTTVIPLFVFDGPGRPNVKRKTSVRSNSHFLNSDFKSLIQCFGWKYVDAPGEAEAELAWMCAQHIIDAVITEDSDTFVFGAPRIIRIREISDRAVDITVYEDIGLSREQLVFMAILAGGDYSDGIPSCGIKKARRLALAGFGDDLIQAVLDMSSAQFREFRPSWCRRFQETLSGQSFSRSLARKIPNNFPDYDTLRLYLCPLSSQGVMSPPVLRWDSSPRLGELAAFAAKNLVWGLDSTQLFQHFKQAVFPELAMRELLK
ncbi:PIN domain-like protein, partial [Hymenopellis radicata]